VTSVGETDARWVATLRVKTGRLLTRPTPQSFLSRPIVEVSSRSVPVDMLDRSFMPPSNLIFGQLENGSHAIPFIRTWRPLTQYNGKTTLRIKARLSRQFVWGHFAFFAQVVYASLVTHVDAFIVGRICESYCQRSGTNTARCVNELSFFATTVNHSQFFKNGR
jgi:hypothetical protein